MREIQKIVRRIGKRYICASRGFMSPKLGRCSVFLLALVAARTETTSMKRLHVKASNGVILLALSEVVS
jgi:hypothetical protein